MVAAAEEVAAVEVEVHHRHQVAAEARLASEAEAKVAQEDHRPCLHSVAPVALSSDWAVGVGRLDARPDYAVVGGHPWQAVSFRLALV